MEINHYENSLWQNNSPLCGIDEVGCGPLAGPVVSAAVILNLFSDSKLIKDSKLLNEKQRLAAYDWIVKNGIFGIGIVNNRCIDQWNIRNATIFAMRRALCNLLHISKQRPEAIIVDAIPLDLSICSLDIPVHAFPRADSLSISVAAASIVAKVTRDRLMNRYDAIIPGYSFDRHKGYGTALHQEAIIKKGFSIVHRTSFLKRFIADQKQEELDESSRPLLCRSD